MLQLIKGGFDFRIRTTSLQNRKDSTFKIDSFFDCSQYFIAGAEQALEQAEFLLQQILNSSVGQIILREEVEHHDIIFLAVAMTATDSLLNALRIPRQVIVDD